MAGTTTKGKHTVYKGSAQRDVVVEFNKLVNDVETLAAAVRLQMPGAVLTAPANKQGTSAATAWRTEAFTFNFRGKTVSAAAQEKALTATTHDVAASKEAWFVLSVQSDGTTFTVTKGADQTPGTVVLPIGPDNEVIVGYMGIVTGAGGIFDASTDALAVAGNIASITFTDAPAIGAAALLAAQVGDASGTAFTS